MKKIFSKKIIKRAVSIFAAVVIIIGAIPLGEVTDGFLPLFSLRARATEYSPTYPADRFSSNTYSFSYVGEFVDYSWHFQHTDGFAASHCNDEITIAFTDSDTNIPDDFAGLGTSTNYFGGTVRFGGENYTIKLHSALFKYVYDSVEFLNGSSTIANIIRENVVFQRLSNVGDDENKPLLAEHVVHDTRPGKTPAVSWSMEVLSTNNKTYSGLIGEIGENAEINLTYNNASTSPADVVSNTDVGAVCGIMENGSKLTLAYTAASATTFGITSSGGNAGGIVGSMKGNASLTINSTPALASSVETTTALKYAGGLVGELTSEATITNSTGSGLSVGGSVKSAEGAGGLFGHYTNGKSEFDLKDYNITSTVYGTYCGGVFGVLENNKADNQTSLALTVKNTGAAGTVNVSASVTGTSAANDYFGGIAGKYETNALANSLVIDGLTVTANAGTQFDAFGGVAGLVDSAAYITTNGTVTVNATGTDDSVYFGGFVGATSEDYGVFVDLGNFTLNNNSEEFKGGGVVGKFNNGVLRLSGTTNMTSAKCACADNCGQLVGYNNNVLVYATGSGNSGSGWIFNRSNGSMADDLGTWGEVVRVNNIETDVLEYNGTDHTVTVKAAATSMGSQVDFAKTALNIQLNQGSNYNCLRFESTANNRATLLASTSTLSLSSDISLAGSGITGFMRDGGAITGIGNFTGTFNGNSHTITLASGETYGVAAANGQVEGMGQIYRHQHNGLFAVLSGNVENLTVDGAINVRNKVATMNIGGIASRNRDTGNVTLNGVTTNVTVNYQENPSVDYTNIGGYIGYVGTNGTITISGVSSIGATFNFSGYHDSWNCYGGAIGKIDANTFTLNVGTVGSAANKLTNGLKMNVSGVTNVGTDSNGGGLVGYIADNGSYSDRTVNINNLYYNGCALYNPASTNGGGLLGYSWLNTTTNVKGLTVTSASINNTTVSSASDVGAMCYNATGKWVVDSLNVQGLTVTGGCGTSLGLIVNKAYNGDKGLYLDVLNAGYTLNASGITLPGTIGVYDEIAAYSASSVINGGNGAGVVSINMNANRNGTEARITQTGTYQNRLSSYSSKFANPNARYYYNIDVMGKDTNGGQDLMLWSLKKYAASNISGEFVSNMDKTISGTANMTGLSFYPLKNANGYTIGNLTLTFDYNGIRNTAENMFVTATTDGYLRDPVESNQHYLMHSGLFIDVPGKKLADGLSNNKLTISGALSVSGTFMEDNSHKGVLISGTMGGDLDCTGSIVLDGIKPRNGANNYTSGYLLINNIARAGDLYYPPTLNLNNVSTTKEYSTATYTAGSTNARVAKSLIGPASGKGLKFELSGIKLDARDGNSTDANLATKAQDLYTAYGTYNSIFTDSTLFASIYTDVNASLEYNYTYDDDWVSNTRNVTYGKEITDSVEYRTTSESKENKYYGDTRYYTNPIDNTERATEYVFSTGFLPYVKTTYRYGYSDGDAQYFRELKVNVMEEGLTEGCGSYNDPYLIRKGSVLESVAKFIQSGNTSDLTEVVLPINYSDFDSIEENASGARWCSDKTGTTYHALYTRKSDTTGYESTANGATDWSKANVQYYLANAYYKIMDDIELGETYVGLGSTEAGNAAAANLAFRGVIVGKEAGSAIDTITNKSDKPFINVSNGCVVKDINIEVNKNINLKQASENNENKNTNANAYFDYYSQCVYYGGIIGEVMGGDNIIDNSYVTYNNSVVTLSGASSNDKSGTIIPVGGYVGVVVFGGVIFKNMTASKTTIENTHLNAVYFLNKQGKYTVTLGGGNASVGDTFTVAGTTYTVAASDTLTPKGIAASLNTALSSNENYTVTVSDKKLTLTEKSGKYGTGVPAVSTTSSTTTISVATNTSSLSGNLADNSRQEAWAAIYVNPIVGRVINGYAVNETSNKFSTSEDEYYHDGSTTRTGAVVNTLKNGKKHYTITDINKNDENKLDVTAVASSGTDGNINVPNAQALFILSLITQSCAGTATDSALGAYNNSLSYGTYNGSVYGMSHIATYNDVGTDTALVYDDQATENVDESNLPDYQKLARLDTANNVNGNAPIPYIIKNYTVGSTVYGITTRTETRIKTAADNVAENDIHYSETKFTETTITSGSKFIIKGTRPTKEYMTNEVWEATTNYVNKRNRVLYSTLKYNTAEEGLTLEETKIKKATEFYFEKHPSNNTYCIYYLDNNNTRYYLNVTSVTQIGSSLPDGQSQSAKRGNLEFSNTAAYFSIEYIVNKGWSIKDITNKYIYYAGEYNNFCAWNTNPDVGAYFDLYTKVETYDVTISEYAMTHNYPARCVTSTAGYYNITLNNSTANYVYQLPDSFRGLGSVGMYDSLTTGKDNRYSIKLNVFDGNEKTIDLDIFLNKFQSDNYFNKLHSNTNQDIHTSVTDINGNTNTNNHGIGLFDSVIMKGSGSKFCDFELSGSVKTAIYSNDYASRGECHNINAGNLFLSVGGVCGWATDNAVNIGFEGIDLNDLTVCGTNHFGGLLGYSGLKSPSSANDTTIRYIWIKECTADNISIKATAGTAVGDARQARCGMGAFVGKVQEGAVYIYGTEYEDANQYPDTNYSEVKIKNYELINGDTNNYNMSAGGLVGFAGNGCKIYDMRLSSKSTAITVGSDKVNFAGGMVGGMQSSLDGGKTGVAIFKNCVVTNINVNGNYAGGIYGGKWDSNWTTYMITMDNCQMIGTEGTHNTIFANDSFGDNSNTNANHVGYAGGLIGKLYPYTNLDDNNETTYNVLIKDCLVKNYDITAATTATSYAGGFIGYASSVNQSITCYMHDSSVENCKIGANGNYAGGVVGRIIQKDNNEILGYNIKLDTITTEAGNKMGAWIGHVPSDTDSKKTSIQLAGMAIYGQGFTKNVGNDATLGTASFVFADYSGACKSYVTTTTTSSSAAKQAGDEDSKTETFTADSSAKTITYVVTTVTVGDTETTTETQTTVYPYISASTADPVSDPSLTESSSVWAVHEDTGSITFTVSDASAHTVTVTTYNLAVSGYNSDDNVVMPKYPYVNVNPQSDMGTGEIISSDGAVLYNSNTTMAAKIYADLNDNNSDNSSRRYTTFSDTAIYDGHTISYYLNQSGAESDRISTYGTEKGGLPTGVDDFAVIVINNQNETETTNLINRYIQLVTNTTTDYTNSSDYYDVVVSQCRYVQNDGKFEIVPNSSGSIVYTAGSGNNSGSFAVNNANADSVNVGYAFTLIDVQFKDPLDTDNIAYHLYVPVYTVKQLEVEFSTVVKTGSHSFADDQPAYPYHSNNDYIINGTHIDSIKTWITHYIRYSYDGDMLNAFLNAGTVKWNNDKKVIFRTIDLSTTFKRLPENTTMILVDPNCNADKMYYAEKLWDTNNQSGFTTYIDSNNANDNRNGWVIDFNKFKDSGNNSFTTSTLNDLIAAHITVSTTVGEKLYIAGSANDYDVYVVDNNGNKTYYKYSAENGTHSLSVPSNYTLNEDYYLTMYVPDSNEMHFYEVMPPSVLEGSRTVKVNKLNSYTVIVADLYEQTTNMTVLPDDLQVNANNKKITVKPSTSIRVKNNDARSYLTNIPLYHSFDLSLNRYYDDKVLDEIIGLDSNSILAKYALGNTDANENSDDVLNKDLQNNYLNIVTKNIMRDLLDAANEEVPLRISSYIELDFDQTKLDDEFPEKTSEAAIGVNVAATSNLAYELERLAYTSMSAPFSTDGHYYYRESVNSAKLDYSAVSELDMYDTFGRESYNQSRLGVNGYPNNCSELEYMPINTEAKYNVSSISELDLNKAEGLRLTVTLSKKTDTVDPGTGKITGVNYVQVNNLRNYIRSGTDPNDPSKQFGVFITSGEMYGTNGAGVTHNVEEGSSSLVVTIPKANCDVLADIYNFGLGFEIKTGENFTEYANYMITLSIELIYTESGQTKAIENSGATDYIVYTNAKIYPSTVPNNN